MRLLRYQGWSNNGAEAPDSAALRAQDRGRVPRVCRILRPGCNVDPRRMADCGHPDAAVPLYCVHPCVDRDPGRTGSDHGGAAGERTRADAKYVSLRVAMRAAL